MNAFTIKDIENLSGIKAHTLRIWEQRYHFLKPKRSETNIRTFSNDDLKSILNIALLNKYGYKISHINKMSAAELSEKILSLPQADAQQERVVNELIQAMIDLDMDHFVEILDNYIIALGIERMILQLIFPFMERIGILWLTSHINPAQEHLVSNIIRQKLIVGIEGVSPGRKKSQTILLYLPEGEHHEIGLLFMYYLLKSRGISVIYLGSNVPSKDVEYIVNLKKPNYIHSHLTTAGSSFNFDKFLANSRKAFPGIPVLITGELTRAYQKKIQPPLRLLRSLDEVMEFIDGL